MSRRLAALAAALAATTAAAGCGGGDGGSSPSTTAAADVRVTVVDGYTAAPIPGAQVPAFDAAGQPIGEIALTDSRGDVTIAAGASAVCALTPVHPIECRTILPERARLRIPLHDPAVEAPQYGGGPDRTRSLPPVDVPPPSGPPAWTYTGKVLLEFPPAVARGTVVLTTNRGLVIAFDVNGRRRWQVRHAKDDFIASSPAIIAQDRLVLVAGMDGRLVAYQLENGRERWTFTAGTSPIESSPLVIGETAYVGAWNGRLYAVSTKTGRLRWSFAADADIKGSAARSGDNVVFGDYGGNVYAVNGTSGELVWRTRAGKRFYGGPGVANGVVVIGDVGGAVVGLDAADGRRLWRHSTDGAFVYASPAIAGDRVFIGSYGEDFLALGLRTGRVLWRFPAGGRISGSATVVGDVVYTSVLARPGEQDRTFGLDIATGKVRWTGDDGRYSPAVAAGRTLYIVGRTSLYAYPAP